MDSNYINRLTFDRKGKYLVGYGDTKVYVMDLGGNTKQNKELEI